jgi:hypothetical protein
MDETQGQQEHRWGPLYDSEGQVIDPGPTERQLPGGDIRPPRCATIGHGGLGATHEVGWSYPDDRDFAITQPACRECTDWYQQQPDLLATAREQPAAASMRRDPEAGQ